ncbi:hypothetical protein THAOC_12262, partial [Thalassiosira oceanica]
MGNEQSKTNEEASAQ